MKKSIKTFILVIIYLFAFSTSVQSFTLKTNETPTTVNAGETFKVKLTVDEATTLANSHIKYDSSLFTFVEAKQTNMSASANQDGNEVSWMYTDLNANSEGIKTFEFTFKAKNIGETKTGTFEITDDVFITTKDRTYEKDSVNGNKTFQVTVKGNGNTISSGTKNNPTSSETTSTLTTSTASTTGRTTTYDNKAADNTKVNSSNLPKTGEETKLGMVIAGISLIITAVIFKKKEKNLF